MKIFGFVLICLVALASGGIIGFLVAEFMDWITNRPWKKK